VASQIEIVEVSPRDGLQNHPTLLPTRDKVELVRKAAAAGARRIEAVSFVNPKAVPQMADAEAVLQGLKDEADLAAQGVRLIGLVLNRRGFDRATVAGVDEVNFVVVASETFNRRNQGASIAETMAQIAETVPLAAQAGLGIGVTIAAAFGCPFEGEVSEAQVGRLAAEIAGFGVAEIALADTIGVGDPAAVVRRLGIVQTAAPGTQLRCHFHNTRNTGLANAYAAWTAGVQVLDASLGGIGGCPFAPAATGNIPTEDTLYMFSRMGVRTGYDLQRAIEAARWLGERLGEAALPGMLGRAGLFPPSSPGERSRAEACVARHVEDAGSGRRPSQAAHFAPGAPCR
jgi:hydroxymethylglutaryl-CoA lyase